LKEVYFIGYIFLLCAVMVWFVLCHRLFKLLKTRCPQKYTSMGSPGLIMNNTIRNNISFIKFLFWREYQELNDQGIIKLSRFMHVFIVVYLAIFLFFALGFLFGYAPGY
jgi:hypothetical protein